MKNQIFNEMVRSMMETYFLSFSFSLLFDLPPNSRGTTADPHQCAAADRLKIAALAKWMQKLVQIFA
jgi:hypothetical protein